MGGIRFILGIHAHQSVGNLSEVFAEAHRRSSVPFLQILSEFPQFPFSLHISGVLFDWLGAAHPDDLDGLAALGGPEEVGSLPLTLTRESWEAAGG